MASIFHLLLSPLGIFFNSLLCPLSLISSFGSFQFILLLVSLPVFAPLLCQSLCCPVSDEGDSSALCLIPVSLPPFGITFLSIPLAPLFVPTCVGAAAGYDRARHTVFNQEFSGRRSNRALCSAGFFARLIPGVLSMYEALTLPHRVREVPPAPNEQLKTKPNIDSENSSLPLRPKEEEEWQRMQREKCIRKE